MAKPRSSLQKRAHDDWRCSDIVDINKAECISTKLTQANRKMHMYVTFQEICTFKNSTIIFMFKDLNTFQHNTHHPPQQKIPSEQSPIQSEVPEQKNMMQK
ncbi:hypothetical protein O6H91_06G108400 [Diphasiastrum complanatum]|uniref:Uncharacterized protein n=1 Tax=Diphasiastrum complanatum TaxID=34168 RepID=A0ACC2DHA3_DIPCM|nr:hypothetical protein O6H91_06G108400 [Diphasiastrum complanatum]